MSVDIKLRANIVRKAVSLYCFDCGQAQPNSTDGELRIARYMVSLPQSYRMSLYDRAMSFIARESAEAFDRSRQRARA